MPTICCHYYHWPRLYTFITSMVKTNCGVYIVIIKP